MPLPYFKEREGTPYHLQYFSLKALHYDCFFCAPNKLFSATVYFYWHQMIIAKNFSVDAQSNLNLEIKRSLNFNYSLWQAIFEIFQICLMDKVCKIRANISSVSLFEIFANNWPFILVITKLSPNFTKMGCTWVWKLGLVERLVYPQRNCCENSR